MREVEVLRGGISYRGVLLEPRRELVGAVDQGVPFVGELDELAAQVAGQLAGRFAGDELARAAQAGFYQGPLVLELLSERSAMERWWLSGRKCEE